MSPKAGGGGRRPLLKRRRHRGGDGPARRDIGCRAAGSYGYVLARPLLGADAVLAEDGVRFLRPLET